MKKKDVFDGISWIVFEGIDGSGKTTQAKLFSQYLTKNNIVNQYRHVFDTLTGMSLRELFINNQDLGNIMEILLLVATRDQFIRQVVLKEKAEKELLITDRFFLSIETMQGLGDKRDQDLIVYLKSLILRDIQPDLHIYIDVPADVCSIRMKSKKIDRIESKGVAFHAQVREAYLQAIKEEPNVLLIDGDQEIWKVHSDIIENVGIWIESRKI